MRIKAADLHYTVCVGMCGCLYAIELNATTKYRILDISSLSWVFALDYAPRQFICINIDLANNESRSKHMQSIPKDENTLNLSMILLSLTNKQNLTRNISIRKRIG